MSDFNVLAPRLNANEDQAVVSEVHVKPGAAVEEGALLFVLETTKASVEVLAPRAGKIATVMVEKGATVEVGQVMTMFEGGEAEMAAAKAAKTAAGDGAVRITAKAKLRAAALGIDVAEVAAVDGRVSEKEVEAFATGGGKPAKGAKAAKGAKSAASAAANSTGKPASSSFDRVTTARAIMIGGGGHAATVADALAGSGWDFVGALDPSLPVGTEVVPGLKVIGGDDLAGKLFAEGVRTAFIGVGGATSAAVRIKIYNKLSEIGFFLPAVVHPSAHIGLDVKLGPATYVMPSAMVGPRCRIGANVIVNSGCIVCHDTTVEDHAHITPGAILAGTVNVGEGSTIGMAATVLFGTSIGRNTVVHNSAAVAGDVGDGLQYTREGKRLSTGK